MDWIERIPFSETRNYAQRVMENLQVHRKRFGETKQRSSPTYIASKQTERRAGQLDSPTR